MSEIQLPSFETLSHTCAWCNRRLSNDEDTFGFGAKSNPNLKLEASGGKFVTLNLSLTDKTIIAFGKALECKNVSEFKTLCKDIPTSINYLFADRYGNIGYFHTGWYPILPEKKILGRRLDRRFPLMGTGKEEWQGILPSEENPQGINPPEGFYANWNNKPRTNWSYSEGHSDWHEAGWEKM